MNSSNSVAKAAVLAAILAAGIVPAVQATPYASIAGTLTLGPTTKVNLNSNALDIKTALIGALIPASIDTDPYGAGWGPGAGLYNGLTGYVQSALWGDLVNFQNWRGPGIYSAVAAVNNLTGNNTLAIGIADNAAYGIASPLYGTDSGFGYDNFLNLTPADLAATDILIRMTYYGDTNLDGLVDGQDLTALIVGANNSLLGWVHGDINYDGVVDGQDLTKLIQVSNINPPGLGNGNLAGDGGKPAGLAVPEPGSAVLALIGSLGILGRRRRNASSNSR